MTMPAYRTVLTVAVFTLPLSSQQFGVAENLAPDVPTPQPIVEKMLAMSSLAS